MYLPSALYLTTKIIKEFVIHLDVDLVTLILKIGNCAKQRSESWLNKKKLEQNTRTFTWKLHCLTLSRSEDFKIKKKFWSQAPDVKILVFFYNKIISCSIIIISIIIVVFIIIMENNFTRFGACGSDWIHIFKKRFNHSAF